MSKNIFLSLVKKESLHIVRDPRTMLITLFIPIILLLLFSFAISTEVNEIRVMVVCEKHSDDTRLAIERLRVNSYFDFQGLVAAEEAENQLKAGNTDAIVYLRGEKDGLKSQIVVDASNTTIAQSSTVYIQGALNGETKLPVIMHTLYNPELKSSYNFVPGIMGMIFILICSLMTSVSIVSEKENGTMDLLLVSPIRPGTIILGKLVPYFLLSCIMLAIMLSIAYTIMGLPVNWEIANVIWVTILYIILSVSIGLLVSTVSKTQFGALMVCGVVFMLPVMMLSGMIFPIDNMPKVLQWLSCIIPARWYISASRKLMIQQLPLSYVSTEVIIMAAMTLFILVVAIKKFSSKKS